MEVPVEIIPNHNNKIKEEPPDDYDYNVTPAEFCEVKIETNNAPTVQVKIERQDPDDEEDVPLAKVAQRVEPARPVAVTAARSPKRTPEALQPSFAPSSSLTEELILPDIIDPDDPCRKKNVEYTERDGKFYCSLCKKSFLKIGFIERHVKQHAESDKHCHICYKMFKTKALLLHHVNLHSNPSYDMEKFKCHNCEREFMKKRFYEIHMADKKCENVCEICNKSFANSVLYKSHLLRHSNDKPYSCEFCDMTFKYKNALPKHALTHTGEKPFRCTLCDKSFTFRGLLKTHMLIHTGERQYKCDLCPKRFALKHNMKRHQKTHEKVKKLTCDLCHKTFPRESRLKYHMRSHNKEKPYQCDICKYIFSHKSNVVKHMYSKHKDVVGVKEESEKREIIIKGI